MANDVDNVFKGGRAVSLPVAVHVDLKPINPSATHSNGSATSVSEQMRQVLRKSCISDFGEEMSLEFEDQAIAALLNIMETNRL